MSDLVFVDTETLGLELDAPVWEFAAIRRHHDGSVSKQQFFIEHDPGDGDWLGALPLSLRVDYCARYTPVAAIDENTAASEIHFITNGAILIACNPGFDVERLAKLLRRNGIEPAWHYHPLDTASMAIGYLAGRDGQPPEQPWKSDELSAAVGVDPASYARHTALGDVRWAIAQWDTVMRGSSRPVDTGCERVGT